MPPVSHACFIPKCVTKSFYGTCCCPCGHRTSTVWWGGVQRACSGALVCGAMHVQSKPKVVARVPPPSGKSVHHHVDSPSLKWERRRIMTPLQRLDHTGTGLFSKLMWSLGQFCSGEVLVTYFVSLYLVADRYRYVSRQRYVGMQSRLTCRSVYCVEPTDACTGSTWCVLACTCLLVGCVFGVPVSLPSFAVVRGLQVPLTEIINGLMKWHFRVPRPGWVDRSIDLRAWSHEYVTSHVNGFAWLHAHLLVVTPAALNRYSFPSSHAQIMTAVVTFFLLNSRGRFRRSLYVRSVEQLLHCTRCFDGVWSAVAQLSSMGGLSPCAIIVSRRTNRLCWERLRFTRLRGHSLPTGCCGWCRSWICFSVSV